MSNDKPILEFEEDSLVGEVFCFADIPDKWQDGDYAALLDRYAVEEALVESADFVDENVFEDGGPGMSGAYYKVYAKDVERFRTELTHRIIKLIEGME
jgi:hypothetical protein